MSKRLRVETEQKTVELRSALKDVITQITAAEKDLWSLRLKEVSIWQAIPPRSEDKRATTIHEQVFLVLDQRELAVNRAITTLATINDTYANLQEEARAAEMEVAEARKRFNSAEERVEHRLLNDTVLRELDQEEARLSRLRDLNVNWMDDLAPLIDARLAEFDGDKIYGYLSGRGFGTESYASGKITKRLDQILARWSGFEEAETRRAEIELYPMQYAASMDLLQNTLARLPAKRAAAVKQIKDSLDPWREKLAITLNKTAAVVERFDAAKRSKTAAVSRIRDCISGSDEETQLVVKAVVALLASERAKATMRGDERMVRAAEADVDKLLKSRIVLSRQADDLRRNATEILALLEDMQSLLDTDAEKSVDPARFEFAMERASEALTA